MADSTPWSDVIIDMQGPFTKAEGGEQYVMSYHCSRLKVPKLAVCKNVASRPLLSGSGAVCPIHQADTGRGSFGQRAGNDKQSHRGVPRHL